MDDTIGEYKWDKELHEIKSAMEDNFQLDIIPQPNMTNYNPGAEYSSTGLICGIGKLLK